jgi:hypothetical protein
VDKAGGKAPLQSQFPACAHLVAYSPILGAMQSHVTMAGPISIALFCTSGHADSLWCYSGIAWEIPKVARRCINSM